VGLLVLLAMAGCRHSSERGDEDDPEPAARTDEVPARAAVAGPEASRPTTLTVTAPERLRDRDLSALRSLDLALSKDDVAARMGSEGGEPNGDPCAELDLLDIAERAPKLTTLRISGCPAKVHAGLAAFASSLESLELVDLTLDSVTLGRITQLERLNSLTLTRVVPEHPELTPVLGQKLEIESLTLRELEHDSVLGDLLGDMPHLRKVRLEGSWAGYRAMLSLAKAKQLRELELIDTSVNNYALNQVKGLDHLHRVEWVGTSINDLSPIYLKDLPIETFTCACPRLGDTGLKQLRFLEELRSIDLPQSRVTGATLESLADLEHLEQIKIAYRDLGPEGFENLSQLPALRSLELGQTTLEDPSAEKLELLESLTALTLDFENLDDSAAERIGALEHLERLDLGGTKISDRALEHFAKLTELRELKLHHTRITNRGLAYISGLHALEVLELDHTDLVDEGVAHLAPLTNLVDLRLDGTLITDAALEHLLGLEKLERLNLANTAVTPAGAAKLSELPSLRAVNLEGSRADPSRHETGSER